MSRFIGTAKAARLTGFSERQVRTWCKDGTLEGAFQPSEYRGKWLIPVSALARFYSHADELEADLAETADAA